MTNKNFFSHAISHLDKSGEKKIADLKISGYGYAQGLNLTQVALEPPKTLILDTILDTRDENDV